MFIYPSEDIFISKQGQVIQYMNLLFGQRKGVVTETMCRDIEHIPAEYTHAMIACGEKLKFRWIFILFSLK
jgi:hypothetical protein